jgi:hypothetical protein
MLESFLDSITSPNLSKITFEFVWDEYSDDDISSIVDLEAWVGIDEILCALADRLSNRCSFCPLTVVLSVRTKGTSNLGRAEMGAFLEKFAEKGMITIVPFKGFLQPVGDIVLQATCDLIGWFS